MGKTVFLVSGATLTFLGINPNTVTENESILEFAYVAQSDGKYKTIRFYKQHVAGHSDFNKWT